jgi:hypothetical protein
VFLSNLSTHNSISSGCYLYTNAKQENSTFKCEGDWRLWRQTAGGWWLAAGGWAVGGWAVTAGGCLPLDGLSLIQQSSRMRQRKHYQEPIDYVVRARKI